MIKKFLIKLHLPLENPDEVLYYSEGKKRINFKTKFGLNKRIRKEDVEEKNVIFVDAESTEEAKEIYENTELNNIKEDIEKLKNNIFKYSEKNELDIIYIIKSTWSQFYIKFNYKTKFLENNIFKDGFKNLKIRFKNKFSISSNFDEVLFVVSDIQFSFSNKFMEDVNNIFENFLNEIKEKLYVDTKLKSFDFGYIKTRNLRDANIEKYVNTMYDYNNVFTKFCYAYYDNDKHRKSFIIYFGDNDNYNLLSVSDDENSEENIRPFLEIQENIRKRFDYHLDEKIDLVISSFSLYEYTIYVVKNGCFFRIKDNYYYNNLSKDKEILLFPSLESIGLAKLNSKFKLEYQQYKIEGDPKYIISHIKNHNGSIQILDGYGNSILRVNSRRFEKKLFEELKRNKNEIGEDNYNFYLSLYLLKNSTFDTRDDVNESKI